MVFLDALLIKTDYRVIGRLVYPLDAGIYALSDLVGHFGQIDLLPPLLRELQRRRQSCPELRRSLGRALFIAVIHMNLSF